MLMEGLQSATEENKISTFSGQSTSAEQQISNNDQTISNLEDIFKKLCCLEKESRTLSLAELQKSDGSLSVTTEKGNLPQEK